MKRVILIWIFSFVTILLVAQENFFLDSISVNQQNELARSLLLNELSINSEMEINDKPFILKEPLLPDLKLVYTPKSFDQILDDYRNTFFVDPFMQSLTVTNSAAYKLNDRLVIGGYSYAGKSIFDLGRNAFNDYSIHGASVWFQYKVSDKFKIETRISVNDRNRFLFP